FIFFIFFISIITFLYNDAVYFSPLEHCLKLLVSFLASFSIVTLYKIYFDDVLNTIIKHIQIVFLINCAFVVCVMLSSGFKSIASVLLTQNSKMVMLASESIRSFDLVMGGGAVASVVFSVFFMFSLSSFLIDRNKLSLISMVFAFLAILFTGRTGLYLTFAFIVPVLLSFNYLSFNRFMVGKVLNNVIVGVFVFMVPLGIFAFLTNVLTPEIYNLLIDNNFSWAFEPIINYINTGGFSSLSSNRLMEMYSNDQLSFGSLFSLLGTSMSGRDLNNILRTDIGYLRALYTSGFIGLIAIFGKYIYLLIIAFNKINKRKFKRAEIPFLIGIIYYLIIIFIVNFKEYHMVIRSGLPLLMIFMLTLFNLKRKIEN
ncbi:hypothetical protein, partial [Colwellia sp. MB02u-6]|uniref:hypothetical protein n=1 Tax=Colwellia sp. MB02u-6 TaxID=2759824 RepID=UPI001C70C5C5